MSNAIGSSPVTGPGFQSIATCDADTLLQWCALQLNDSNAEIKQKMNEQRGVREQKQQLNDLRAELAKYPTGIPSHMWKEKQAILEKYAAVLSKMPEGPNKAALMTSFNEFRRTGCYNNAPADQVPPAGDLTKYADPSNPDSQIHKDIGTKETGVDNNGLDDKEVKGQLDALDKVGDEMSKSSEIDMMNLTQLVSARQNAIQQTTNLMAKFQQGFDYILQNLK